MFKIVRLNTKDLLLKFASIKQLTKIGENLYIEGESREVCE